MCPVRLSHCHVAYAVCTQVLSLAQEANPQSQPSPSAHVWGLLPMPIPLPGPMVPSRLNQLWLFLGVSAGD